MNEVAQHANPKSHGQSRVADATTRRETAPAGSPFSLSRLATTPFRAVRRVFRQGLFDTARRGAFLAHAAYREWRLGIRTEQFVNWFEITDDPCSVDYEPTGYRTIDRALNYVAPNPTTDVFLDYGCGQGRVLAEAAGRPFQKVIGVELSSELIETAERNLRRAAPRLRCKNYQIVKADAKHFVLPDEVTVVFLFNPFRGHILAGAIEQIRRSLQRNARPLTILYVQPLCDPNPFAYLNWLIERSNIESEGLRLGVYESNVT